MRTDEPRRPRSLFDTRGLALLAFAAAALTGCATAPSPPPGTPEVRASEVPVFMPAPADRGPLLAHDDEYAVVLAQPGDTVSTLAARYLGDADRGWWIADLNGGERLVAGQSVLIPRKGPNPLGIQGDHYQTVPILCYHRFGSPKRRLVVTKADFEAQMDYLARHGYTVIPLSRLVAFLEGREALPPKSVVITIDDGYKSSYEIAFPALRKHGFPATVFLYTDFVGAGDAMSWAQMQEMTRTGLIEIQPHSKTHSNLALRLANESQAQYRERLRNEIERPAALIGERLGVKATSYAFPYGDVNETVVGELQRIGVRLGVTVTPGGNPFFAYPYMLRRTMVFGTDDLDAFKARLAVFARVTRADPR
jgi:peptidoglycan/xylan/chitin deacetylase (PgdA/CDA1 family)